MAGSVALHVSVAALVLAQPRIVPEQGADAGLVQVRLVVGPAQRSLSLPDLDATSLRPVPQVTPALNAVSAPQDIASPVSSSREGPEPVYMPSAMMDRRPTPVSAPDLQRIDVKPISGLPIRLRIYVAQTGQVVRVEPLSVSELDGEFARSVAAMFEETLFLPGRRDGVDRNSYLDIELLAE